MNSVLIVHEVEKIQKYSASSVIQTSIIRILYYPNLQNSYIDDILMIFIRAVCRNFAKGGANLPYFKKRGAQLQAVSGGTLEDNVVPHST